MQRIDATPGLGTSEIRLIVGVPLLFFSAKKLPNPARGLGQGIRECKDTTPAGNVLTNNASIQ